MALFAQVAQLADSLANESSRLAKRAAIAGALAEVHRAAPGSQDAALFTSPARLMPS
jgi:DNA ligase-1